ncbi:MAG: S1 RNA-binding domain-containing protein [Candidatus Bipolaricaulota bacterium]|nr:S1 RNA-binding domain-containing protein [Candidatus Bipolaricaulota bacterium]MBS3791557.1 S1 RNA-binding domain-containing protein [Candidatus Bipolaricaulota bacterium]
MDIREGEKVSGVVEELSDEGYTVALCNDITGFVPKDNLTNEVESSSLEKGSEVKVRVNEKTEDGSLKLTITKLFARDKFQQKPDKYLENLSYEKNNGGEKSPEPKIAEEFQEWLTEVEDTFEEIKQNRKERLNEDFWTV